MEKEIEMNTSAFNEAAFKMRRLDKLQEICNLSRASPLQRDEQRNSGILNHFNALVSLYQEVSSKLKDTEQKQVKPKLKELRPLVRSLNIKLPSLSNQSQKIKWYNSDKGQKALNNVVDKLFDVEELIRKFLDEKGFATLNNENLEGDQYN